MANSAQPGMRSEAYGELQNLVDNLYKRKPSGTVTKVDVPSGTYARARLCDQINSIVTAHGWGFTYGTVE